MTHASFLDLLRQSNEELLVLLGVLSSDKNLDSETSALDLVEMLRYTDVRYWQRSLYDSRSHLSSQL